MNISAALRRFGVVRRRHWEPKLYIVAAASHREIVWSTRERMPLTAADLMAEDYEPVPEDWILEVDRGHVMLSGPSSVSAPVNPTDIGAAVTRAVAEAHRQGCLEVDAARRSEAVPMRVALRRLAASPINEAMQSLALKALGESCPRRLGSGACYVLAPAAAYPMTHQRSCADGCDCECHDDA